MCMWRLYEGLSLSPSSRSSVISFCALSRRVHDLGACLRLAREQTLCRKTVRLCALPDTIYYLVNNRVFFCFHFSASLPFSLSLSLSSWIP